MQEESLKIHKIKEVNNVFHSEDRFMINFLFLSSVKTDRVSVRDPLSKIIRWLFIFQITSKKHDNSLISTREGQDHRL